VLVGAGAKVLGPFTVGEGSRIAAGSVVLRELPPYSTAVGAPARVVRIAGERVDTDAIDHVHIPDPVAAELESLRQAIARLETRLSERGL
jgi:serine O-acetyltransferase